MDKEALIAEIEALIDRKIREHETRVGWVSGIIGLSFVFGIVHSIWLLKSLTP
jgi:ABC-type nickel/cobalt efflux system permease component RcnA